MLYAQKMYTQTATQCHTHSMCTCVDCVVPPEAAVLLVDTFSENALCVGIVVANVDL